MPNSSPYWLFLCRKNLTTSLQKITKYALFFSCMEFEKIYRSYLPYVSEFIKGVRKG